MPGEHRRGISVTASRLAGLLLVSAVIGALVGALAFPVIAVATLSTRKAAQMADSLPRGLTSQPLAQRSRLLDRRGHVIAQFYDHYRISVPLSDVAPIMREAQVAIEDSRFYRHGALDVRGTLRAFVTNRTSGHTAQGGSSITQQLVKMTLLEQAKTKQEQAAATAETYQRKLRELRYALGIERTHSKDWILQRYLNIAYYGDGAYGVEAAARHYFSRPASRLTLPEAAMIAGLVQDPTGYNPAIHPSRARARRDVVLDRLASLGVVSHDVADRAKSRPLGLRITRMHNGCTSATAPFFCDYVRQYLLHDGRLGKDARQGARRLRTAGLTIRTTFDPRVYKAASRAVRRHVHPKDHAVGALALVEPGTGAVRAIAQSRPMGTHKKRGETFLDYAVPRSTAMRAGPRAAPRSRRSSSPPPSSRASRSAPRSRRRRR